MPDVRPSAVGTITAFRTGELVLLPNNANGLRVMTIDDFISEFRVKADAAPTTLRVGTLEADGKHTTAQIRYTSLDFQGSSTVAALPAPGTLTSGQFYLVTDTGTNHGKTWTQPREMAVSDGTNYHVGPIGVGTIAQGGTGATTAAGARTNLDVPDNKELQERTLARPIGNGVRFLGDGKASPGDPPILVFGNGSTDEPFAFSTVLGTTSLSTAQGIAGKVVGAGIEWEAEIRTDGKIQVSLYDNTLSNKISAIGNTVIEVNRRYYVGFSYNGNGSSGTDISIYVNEIAQTITTDDAGTYVAMHEHPADFNLGGDVNGKYLNGIVYSATVWNSELSAANHKTLSRNGNRGLPGFIVGKAVGGIYTSDFSAGVDGFTFITATLTGNYDSGDAGHADTLRIVADDGSSDRAEKSGLFIKGHRYRVEYNRKVIAGTSALVTAGGAVLEQGFTDATWQPQSWEFDATETHPLRFYPANAGSANDEILIDGVKVTDVGPRLDYQPENIRPNGNIVDSSANKLRAVATNATPIFRPTSGQVTEEVTLDHGSISSTAATTELLKLPKGCRVVSVETDITTAFDATTNIDIGTSGTADKYANNIDVASVAKRYNSSSHPSESDTVETSIYAQKSGSTTTGSATLKITYEIITTAV